jgi:negative regulator of genetic competence, sporulation and motility
MKKRIIATMLILTIPTSLITGCGKSITRTVASAVTSNVIDIVEDAVATSSNPNVQSIEEAIEASTNPMVEAVRKYANSEAYSTDEFLAMMQEEIDNCYQNDASPDATPCKRVYTKNDDMVVYSTITFSLLKDFVEDYYDSYIQSTASSFYSLADSYYLDILDEGEGYLKCEIYLGLRDSYSE